MSRTWWVRRLFAARPRPTGRPAARPRLVGLEDRTVPASTIDVQLGGSLAIPAGASDFADPGVYTIDPSALDTATADVVFRATGAINFLAPVSMAGAGVSLDAEARGGLTLGAALTTTAGGNVRLAGEAGAAGAVGVFVAADLTAGGNVLLTGTGSAGVSFSAGVLVFAPVTAAGTLSAVGTGGSDAGGSNDGVNIDLAGSLLAGGDLTVTGFGGGGGFSNGVLAFGSLTSTGGTVSVTGTGGGADPLDNIGTGVFLFNTLLTAGGPGGVVLDGTGGAGGGGLNDGVLFSTAAVTSAGPVTATGRAGAGADSFGVRHSGGTSTAGTTFDLVTDSLDIDPSSALSAGTTLAVRPLTAAVAVNLGGADSAAALGLTSVELATLAAPTVVVGTPANTGGVGTSAAVVAPAGADFVLITAGPITLSQNLTVAGKTLGLSGDAGVTQTAGAIVAQAVVATSSAGSVNLGDADADDVSLWVNQFAALSGSAPGDFTATNSTALAVGPAGPTGGSRVAVGTTTGLLTVAGPVTATAKNVSLYAPDLELTAPVSAPAPGTDDDPLTGNVRLLTPPDANATPIALGGAVPGSLSLSQADLNLTAGRLVQVGDGFAGPLTVVGPVAAPAGFSKLVLSAGGLISQSPGAGLTVDQLSVAPAGAADGVTLTDPANDVRVFSALGGSPAVDVRFATTGDLRIGRVGLIAGVTGNLVQVTAAGSLTVDVPDATGTPAEPFSFPGVAADGGLVLTAGKNLTVAGTSKLQSLVGVALTLGQTGAGTLTLSGASLTGTVPTAITGGGQSDTFNLSGSATSAVTVDGGAPVLPTFPGDVLNYTQASAGLVVTYTGPSDGTLTDSGVQPVTFVSIESLAASGSIAQVTGGAGADYLWLFNDGTRVVYRYSADGGATFSGPTAVGGPAFAFVGNAGRDVLKVDYTVAGDPLGSLPGGVTFDGTDKAGDTLAVFGSGAESAVYTPSTTTTGSGVVVVFGGAGTGVVSFSNLSPVDVSGLTSYTVNLTGAVNTAAVADGTDFLTLSQPAVVVTGTVDGFAIEPTSVRNVGTLLLIGAGDETVTLGPVSTDPAVATLVVDTGTGADTVSAVGGIGLTGDLLVNTVDLNLLSFISVGGSATFGNSGTLTLTDAAVLASGAITQTGGPVVLAGTENVLFTPFATISLQGAIDAAVDGTSKLSATANDPTLGVVTLSGSVGATSRPDDLFLNGSKQISLGGPTYRTTGDQIDTGPVRVSAPAVGFESAGGVIQFLPNTPGEPVLDGVAAGGSAVTATAPGGVTFGGPVGSVTALASLTTAGGTTRFAGGRVQTVGDQTYLAPVVATGQVEFRSVTAADPAAVGTGRIQFKQSLTTVPDAVAVLVSTTGPIQFFGPVTAGSLTLPASGPTDINGGTITTVGAQSYAGPVQLSANTILSATTVTFGSTLDSDLTGPYTLAVNAAVSFAADVGRSPAGTPLASLNVLGAATVAGNVRTVGFQFYAGPVTVSGGPSVFDTVLAPGFAAVGTGPVTFDSDLNGPGGVLVRTAGDTTFAGPVGVASLRTDGGGRTVVAGGSVLTTGSQEYADPVVLAGPPGTLFRSSASGVTFGGTLNAVGGEGAAVEAAGDVTFAAAVGNTGPLGFLRVSAAPATAGGTARVTTGVSTSGPQLYELPVRLLADTTFTSTGDSVDFARTLDAAAAGAAGATVNSPTLSRFRGAVGGQPGGTLAFLRTSPGGETQVLGGLVQTTGDQTFGDRVVVAGSATFKSVAGAARGVGPVTFAASLTGGDTVTVDTDGGVTFLGPVTANRLLVTGPGGRIDLNGGTVTTAGEQTYAAPVVLSAGTTLTGSAVLFARTLDSLPAGPFALAVNAAVTFGGAVGRSAGLLPLASLSVSGPATVAGGAVRTVGSQLFGGPVTVAGQSAVFDSTAAGDLTFAGPLDAAALGAFGVTATTAGTTRFGGPVGGTGPLAFLTVDGGDTTVVGGGLVQTTGDQTFLDPVSAPGDVTFQTVDPLTGAAPGTGGIRFLDPSPTSLVAGGVITITTLGPIVFEGGVVAAGLRLGAAGGSIDLNGGSITTTGEQVYAADVVLTEDLVLTASRVTFGGRVDSDLVSNWRLAVVADVGFGGEVGGAKAAGIAGRQPLGRLDVTGTATVGGGLVRTTDQPNAAFAGAGSQNYAGPVSITRFTLFEAVGSKAGAVRFLGTLDATGEFGATVTTAGLTEFAGSVGGTGALGNLTTDGGGDTVVRGTAVRTVRGQTYLDAVRVDGVAVVFSSLAGGDLRFADRLDSLPATNGAVTLATDGAITLQGAVGKVVPLSSLTTAGGGTTSVSGGDVVTVGPGGQRYGQPVRLVTNTTFTSSGEVNFDNRLDAAAPGGASATVNTFFSTRFAGPVGSENPLSALTTDAPGLVLFAGGLVRTTSDQTYLDPAITQTGTQFVSDAGTVRFAQSLDGPGDAVVAAPATVFGGAVGGTAPGVVQVSGPATVAGGLVRAVAAVRFGGPVTVTADTTFATTAAAPEGVSFGGTLAGAGKAVAVNTAGRTAFAGDVSVGSLATDAPGTTAVGTGSVTAAGAIDFGDPVVVSNPTLTLTGGSVRFGQSLTGPGTDLTVDSPGETGFDGPVQLRSLATDAPGTTRLNAGSVATAAGQTYGDPVTLAQGTRFDAGGSVTFQQTLTGLVTVDLNVAGETVFNGGVSVGKLSTDAPGLTRVNGGGVATAGDQRYGDPVRVDGKPATFAAGGAVLFDQTLDGPQAATVTAPGDTLFGANVGGNTPLAALTLNGGGRTILRGGQVRTTGDQDYGDKVFVDGPASELLSGANVVLRDDFTSRVPLAVETTGKLTQTGGAATAPSLRLATAGDSSLDRAGNDFDTVTAKLGGTLRLSDADDLTLADAGLTAAGGFVRVRTGGDFTAPASSTVSVPGGQFVVYPGLNGTGATVRFAAPTTATQVVLGRPTEDIDRPAVATPVVPLPDESESPAAAGFAADANTGADTFLVRPVAGTPVFVFGNQPRAVPGDRLLPDFAGRSVVQFAYDGKDGFYVLSDGAVLRFSSIESLSGLSLAAFVAQTGEPRDASGATSQQYSVRVSRTQNGTVLTGGLQGARLPENPFVVSPALVNPAASTQPPRLAFGDFNGDNVPDLVLANGPGTPPLVTVIDGSAVDVLPDGSLSDIATLQTRRGRDGRSLILAQFYAYDPGFQGGVNVAVGDLGGGGLTIVTSADEGGGPRVRSFRLVPQAGQASPFVAEPAGGPFGSFFGYEASFTGGVRVAVADVTGDGVGDLILVPGAGGGPRVRVFSGADQGRLFVQPNGQLAAADGGSPSYADFFTVEESFRGGLYVAAGLYRPGSTRADIVVGAAGGGGPRVMVFAGDTVTQTRPTVLADFFAFTDAEQSDPLFGRGGFFTGVGGVSFGGRGAGGFLDVLASTGRGPQLIVRQLEGGANLTRPVETRAKFDLTTAPASLIPPLENGDGVELSPNRLTYGATVGGFVDPGL